MNRAAPSPPAVTTLPRVAARAGIGVGLVLLALHSLAVGTGDGAGPSSVEAAQVRLRLDPGVATREELMLLPRIGPTIADYIIEYRESVRPARAFHRAEDLAHVHRIGPATVEQLRPFLWFPPARADDHAEATAP